MASFNDNLGFEDVLMMKQLARSENN